MQEYFTALFVTIAVEFVICFIYIRKNPLQALLYVIIINCLTHPVAYYSYLELTKNSGVTGLFNIYFIIVEIIVFLAEILLIKILFQLKLTKAILISFSANLVTAILSFII